MRKNKRVCILMALLFSFLCFPSDKVLAASNMTEVPLTIKQSFEIKNPAKEMDFTGNYEFCALDVDSPMPEGCEKRVCMLFRLTAKKQKQQFLYRIYTPVFIITGWFKQLRRKSFISMTEVVMTSQSM